MKGEVDQKVDQIHATTLEAPEQDRVLPLLQVISDLVAKRCDRFLSARYGLTVPQYQLLIAAYHQTDSTLGGLSEHLNCSRGNVTGIVDRLERDGWLERERSAEDRRVITVKLTEKGNQIEQVREALTVEMANMAEIWEPTQRTILRDLLVRMYRELRD